MTVVFVVVVAGVSVCWGGVGLFGACPGCVNHELCRLLF